MESWSSITWYSFFTMNLFLMNCFDPLHQREFNTLIIFLPYIEMTILQG